MRKLIAIGLLLASTNSWAGLIFNYAIEVGGTSGTFSYQAEADQTGQFLNYPFESFDLIWNNVQYTAADMNFSSIWLTDGRIRENWATTVFGSNCSGTICGVSASISDVLFQASNINSPVYRSMAFGQPGATGVQTTNYVLTYLGVTEVVEDVVTSVPEPGTAALLGIGLLALLRKRAQKP